MTRIFLNIAFLSCALTLMAGCAGGRTAFNKAQRLEEEGKLDEAVLKYAEASSANPDISEYRMRLLKASEIAARAHFEKGEALSAQQKYDEALSEYQSALALDASLSRAKQQSEHLVRLKNSQIYYKEAQEFERGNKPREALQSYRKSLDLNPDNKEARSALERLLRTKQTRLEGFELNLKSTKPITLKFKDAKIKDVFYILTQLSGINFIFDEGVKDQNVTVYLENASFQQSLDILTGMNKLGKKVLNESTIVIFPKNPEKSKQYEDLVVKTFYLNTLDAKKAVNLLRTMLQVRKIYVNEDLNAIVVRDTPDLVDVAQKILDANDVPDAEVLLEVEVIEISKNNTENFGLALSRYDMSLNTLSPQGAFLSSKFDPSTTTTSTSTVVQGTQPSNLLQVFGWKGFGGFVTVPSATYSFGKLISNAEVLANPKIRVKNREKSKFNVGTRVPITTTSTTGTVGGVNVNVQYIDVGVKVNAEPVIQLDNDVSIKLSVEVSSITDRQTIGTDQVTTVVTIGTRNLDTVLNLKDGETSIVGGLIQDNKTKSKQKVFLLGDIPLLGPLLTSNSNTNTKTELVLAITPHIVRALAVPEPDVSSFWSGKEDEPSATKPFASFAQEPEFAPAKAPVAPEGTPKAAPAPAAKPATPAPGVQSIPPVAPQSGLPALQPGVQPPLQPASPATQPPAAPVPVPTPSVPAPATQAVPPATQTAALPPSAPAPQPVTKGSLNIAAPSAVNIGTQFKIEIKVSDVKDLAKAPFTLIYDPIFIDYIGATEGNFLNRDGKPTTFSALADKSAGRVTISLSRGANLGGVEGSGTLLTAMFAAKNKGPASLGLLDVKFADQGGRPIDMVPYNTVIEVK